MLFRSAPEYDRAIAWDDSEIAIEWPDIKAIVSPKDKQAPKLRDSDVNFIWGEAQ